MCDQLFVGRFSAGILPVKGHEERPTGGHGKCPLVAMRTAHSWPTDLPTKSSAALAMRGASASSSESHPALRGPA